MERSSLSKYAQTIRLRSGFSIDYLAYASGLNIEDIIQFEEAPETLPLFMICKIFDTLHITNDEFIQFQMVNLNQYRKNFIKNKNTEIIESKNILHNFENVISLFGSKTLTYKKK
jgi:hypothetical protein